MNIEPSYIGFGLFCFGLLAYNFFPERPRYILITTALLHRLYYFFISPVPSGNTPAYCVIKGMLIADAQLFQTQAFFFSDYPGFISIFKPFYSLLVSVIYFLTGSRNFQIMIFIQHLLGIGFILMFYEIGRKLLEKEWAFVMGLMSACFYYLVNVEAVLTTEAVGMCLAAFSIYLLMIYHESSKKSFCVMGGVALAYSNLIRPVTIIAALPLGVYILYLSHCKKKFDWSAAVLFWGMVVLLTSIAIGFNYYCFDTTTIFKTGTSDFWIAANPKYDYDDSSGKALPEILSKGNNYKERNDILVRETMENLKRYPLVYLNKVWKIYKHAVQVDHVWKDNRSLYFVLVAWFLIGLAGKHKVKPKHLLLISIPLLINLSMFFYFLFFLFGLSVLMRSDRYRDTAGWLLLLFVFIALGLSLHGLDGPTERISTLTQWTRDIFCFAAFAYLVEWITGEHILLVSGPVCWDKTRRFPIPKMVFLFMAIWALAGFTLLVRSSVKFRRRMDVMAEFKKEIQQGKYLDEGERRKREVEIVSQAVGEFYKEINDENRLLGKMFRNREELENRLSAFPKLYNWFLKNLNNPDKTPPQVLVGGIDYGTATFEPNEVLKSLATRPFRRTAFLIDNNFLYMEANRLTQNAMPISGYENSFKTHRVFIPRGITEDIRGKKVLIFGRRFRRSNIFKGKFMLEYKVNLKDKTIKLRLIH